MHIFEYLGASALFGWWYKNLACDPPFKIFIIGTGSVRALTPPMYLAAYFYIVFLVWKGEVAQLAQNAGPAVAKAVKVLFWFVLVGWAIYPLGYILGTPGGLFGMQLVSDPAAASAYMDVVYNIGDAVNKIGFGLVIYSLAVSSKEEAA